MNSAGVPLADIVRQTINETLSELGCDVSGGIHEAILIRQGLYCGRRFECDGGTAVWFIEENQIKFYDRSGALACVTTAPGVEEVTVPATSLISPRRRAA
jgi:hypothetical protein